MYWAFVPIPDRLTQEQRNIQYADGGRLGRSGVWKAGGSQSGAAVENREPKKAASVWAFLLSDETKYSMLSPVRPPKLQIGQIWETREFIRNRILLKDVPLLHLLTKKMTDRRISRVTGSVYTIDRGMLA